jgi:hypothetical protein
MVKRWLPERAIVVVADSSFAAVELLAAVREQTCMITRLRLDAALYDPAPKRSPGTTGRPRRKGARQPRLQAVLDAPSTQWRTVTVPCWYSQGARDIEITSGTAVWYHVGAPVVPLCWVLVRDPAGRFAPQAYLCTEQEVEPQQIVAWFIQRWQVEVTFEEVHAGPGDPAPMVRPRHRPHDTRHSGVVLTRDFICETPTGTGNNGDSYCCLVQEGLRNVL